MSEKPERPDASRRWHGRLAEHRVFDPIRGEGLKARALKGSAWTMSGYGASQVLRLGSNLILTRLLFPEAFGLMALVQVFMQGLQMFSDVGIGPSIIQNKRGDDPDFLNTAWTIQVVRGFVLWIVACLIAIPVASFYGEPMLMQLLPVAGLSAVIAGFNSTKIFTCNRHLLMGRLTSMELVSQLIGITATVLFAWWLRSVWGLVLGGLVGTAAKVILAQTTLPGPINRFNWDSEACRDLVGFGKWIFLATVLTFFARQGDKLVLGSFLTISELGVYSIGIMLAGVPLSLMFKLAPKIFYPSFAQLNHLSASAFRKRTEKHRFRLLLGWAVISSFFISFIDLGVLYLWDDRYADAAWMAGTVGFMLWPVGLNLLTMPMLTARGEPKFNTLGQSLSTISVFTLVPLGFMLGGIQGGLLGYVGSRSMTYAVSSFISARRGLHYITHDIMLSLLFIMLVLLLSVLRLPLGLNLPSFALQV